MRKTRILFNYRGILSSDNVRSFLAEFESERPGEKRVYHIMVECLQNVVYHGVKEGEVVVKIDEDQIETTNLILNSEIENLTKILEEVNTCDLDKLYQEKLTNKTFSDKGTAGLGLIYIARKSNQKLKYDFQAFNDLYTTFTLKISLTSGIYQTTPPSSHDRDFH